MSLYGKRHQNQIDEVRYMTIGRGHGFAELEGVPFKLSESLQHSKTLTNAFYQLESNLEYSKVNDNVYPYTFELERKVLSNMSTNFR